MYAFRVSKMYNTSTETNISEPKSVFETERKPLKRANLHNLTPNMHLVTRKDSRVWVFRYYELDKNGDKITIVCTNLHRGYLRHFWIREEPELLKI